MEDMVAMLVSEDENGNMIVLVVELGGADDAEPRPVQPWQEVEQ